MEKTIYLVRHCAASGQASEAPLTDIGQKQSEALSDFFANLTIDRIISSPFLRAHQSVEPLSQNKELEIKVDDRLSERVLSTENLPDWLEKLKATFDEPDLSFVGGESAREATNRVMSVVEECLKAPAQTSVIVTHGNLLSLLIKHFDSNFGFEDWSQLTNPDVFRLKVKDEGVEIERVWD